MNRWIVTVAVAGLLPVTISSSAGAAEDTTAALLACAKEPNDAQRLRCFDALSASLRRAPATAPAAAPAAKAAVAAVAATPAPASAPTAEERFGARGELKPDKHEQVSEITATVTQVGAKPHGELIVTLDNGQTWAEIATGSKARVKEGDTVKIESGSLGSFRLIAPNGRSTKVARIH